MSKGCSAALLRLVSFFTVLVLVLGVAGPQEAIADKMYWTEARFDGIPGKIQRANLDGSGVEALLTVRFPFGIALDVAGGKMYWTDAVDRKIQRANLDGSGVEDLLTGLSEPFGITLDLVGGKMYWTNVSPPKIQRANLDGSGVEDLVTAVTAGFGQPPAIALDVAGGKMYWVDNNKVKIQRANLDGSGVEDLVTGLIDPHGIALDIAGNKMYWTDSSQIRRANLDGSGMEDFGLRGTLFGIALDLVGGKMYWTNTGRGSIERANLDGSGAAELVTGLSASHGIALDLTVPDADDDGVPDEEDDCPNSDLSATIVIDGCNSGVTNTLFPSGCTISDLIAECAKGARNHGQFVSCVSHLTNDLKKAGTITGQQKGAIQSCAAKAHIP